MFYDKQEICYLPHTAIRKQPYPARFSVMSAIKFIHSSFLSSFGQFAVYGAARLWGFEI
jgi:hypothetical protein